MGTLFGYLEAMGALGRIVFDLSLARGLDYYTGEWCGWWHGHKGVELVWVCNHLYQRLHLPLHIALALHAACFGFDGLLLAKTVCQFTPAAA